MGVLAGATVVAVGAGPAAGEVVGTGEGSCAGTVVGVDTTVGSTPGTSVGVGSWVGVGAGVESTLLVADVDSTVSAVGASSPGPPGEQPIAINRPRARVSPMKTEVRGG